MYISGMPGTGKTACSLEVIKSLRQRFNFRFIHINAKSLSNPNAIYTIMHKSISGQTVCPALAAV